MTSHWIRGMRRVVRRLGNITSPEALILLYHRVAEADSDPWSLCVTPQHFAEHLEVMRKHGCPMQLQQLNRTLRDGKLAPRSIAITFDDGYADNLYNGKPLLERYDIPATVFVASGYVGHEREFWWDELERLFLRPGTLPKTLRLDINGSPYQWDLDGAVNYGEDEYQRHRGWYATHDAPSPRHAVYYSLWRLLGPLREHERHKVLDELLEWSGTESISRPSHRTLSPEELLSLRQGNLIEIGSHTVTHPFLSILPATLQQDEVRYSKAHLEDLIGEQVSSFAYPFGNYTAETLAIVRDSGFAYAYSTVTESIHRRTDRFQLPRFEVQNWDGEELARRLSRWFHT